MLYNQVVSIWNNSNDKKDFRKRLLKEGFIRIGAGRRAVVFSKPQLEYVVKIASVGGVPSRKFKEPELEKFRLGYLFLNGNRQVAIQRKAKRTTKSKYRAWARIRDSVDRDISDYDIHHDNVGWIDGKPVIFDYK